MLTAAVAAVLVAQLSVATAARHAMGLGNLALFGAAPHLTCRGVKTDNSGGAILMPCAGPFAVALLAPILRRNS